MNRQILSSILLFLGLAFVGSGCPGPDTEVRKDPLSGRGTDRTNNPIPVVSVISALEDAAKTSPWLDSALTSSDGSYTMRAGFPNDYTSSATPACSAGPSVDSKSYSGMHPFVLAFLHPAYDTLIAEFSKDTSGRIAARTYFGHIDTSFIGNGANYGAVGTIRSLPTVIMKLRRK